MHKKILALFLLTNLASSISASSPDSYYVTLQVTTPRPANHWGTLKTVAAGATIGASTGLLARLLDSKFSALCWYFTYILRNSIVSSLADTAIRKGEYVDHSLLANTAWASDWITYLTVLGVESDLLCMKPHSHIVVDEVHHHYHYGRRY